MFYQRLICQSLQNVMRTGELCRPFGFVRDFLHDQGGEGILITFRQLAGLMHSTFQ